MIPPREPWLWMIDQSGISELLNAVRPDDARTHMATFAWTGITVASGRTDPRALVGGRDAFALPECTRQRVPRPPGTARCFRLLATGRPPTAIQDVVHVVTSRMLSAYSLKSKGPGNRRLSVAPGPFVFRAHDPLARIAHAGARVVP